MTVQALYAEKRSLFDRRQGQLRSAEVVVQTLETEIADLSTEVELLGKVLAVFHEMSTSVQERFIVSIERLVSTGLTAVFGTEILFKITPAVRARAVHLDFSLQNHDGTTTDLMDARGGGLVSACGVILRIVLVRMLKRRVRQVLFLDEPFAHLSDEYVEPMAELLRRLADELNVQIVLISHHPGFLESADMGYRVELHDGLAKVSGIR